VAVSSHSLAWLWLARARRSGEADPLSSAPGEASPPSREIPKSSSLVLAMSPGRYLYEARSASTRASNSNSSQLAPLLSGAEERFASGGMLPPGGGLLPPDDAAPLLLCAAVRFACIGLFPPDVSRGDVVGPKLTLAPPGAWGFPSAPPTSSATSLGSALAGAAAGGRAGADEGNATFPAPRENRGPCGENRGPCGEKRGSCGEKRAACGPCGARAASCRCLEKNVFPPGEAPREFG